MNFKEFKRKYLPIILVTIFVSGLSTIAFNKYFPPEPMRTSYGSSNAQVNRFITGDEIIADVAEAASKSVVFITTLSTPRPLLPEGFDIPFFRDFFGEGFQCHRTVLPCYPYRCSQKLAKI